MSRSTKRDAGNMVGALLEEWAKTPPLCGVIIEVKVRSLTGEILATAAVRCGDPVARTPVSK